MYIKSMTIKKLHKVYNYDIKFNQDITILYGENGSGKTTILSILETVLTAKIWKLFDIKFEQITLQGKNGPDNTEQEKADPDNTDYSIDILRNIDKENGLYLKLEISENGKKKSDKIFQTTINSLDVFEENIGEERDDIFVVYPILSDIRRAFNELYLPINRIPSNISTEKVRLNPFRQNNLLDNINIDNALQHAVSLIEKENRIIESRKNRYNSEFKNEILSSSLDINTDQLDNLLQNELIIDVDKINDLNNKYLKMLDDLDVPDEHKQKINSFLKNYQQKLPSVMESLRLSKKNSNDMLPFDILITFLFEASEIVRMKKVLPIAEKLEKRLSDISGRINNFTNIVNSFFEDSMEKKKLVYGNFGKPYFNIKGRTDKIGLEYLSSGEKQIVILFANLVLTNQYSKLKIYRNIFIADEPEISLHMLWQMKLIPNILKSRKNLQIILATHSPEIVGEYENKMFELSKERVDNE
ncbi:ABC transporter ATP-binding protein [Streptococcus salivarius]|uniref:AAA family ATPase n=1 Tax=Streptococcus salivarius TaxID=1304 RepID=UPI000E523E5C|nr:AAA family ATPase [Streptococcus salivarius]RGR59198.1 ABC transporter ATP-binding protein [Streptococcus salivarius]